jgi:hypothetical protein
VVEPRGGRAQRRALIVVELADDLAQPGDLPRACPADDGPACRSELHTPADTALSQGHIILAARLDSGAAEVASLYS